MAAPTVEHLVADSGAFIRNATLESIGSSIYSLPDVVSEIRDKHTRQRLHILPYEIIFREPSTDAIKFVSDFSKKTGDYANLSAVDIRVVALTYQLEKQHVGTEHIQLEPKNDVQVQSSTRHPHNLTEIAGFYMKDKTKSAYRKTSECSSSSAVGDATLCNASETHATLDNKCEQLDGNLQTVPEKMAVENSSVISENRKNSERSDSNDSNVENKIAELNICDGDLETNVESVKVTKEGDVVLDEWINEEDEEDDDDEDDDDEEEGGGWITPSNIATVKQDLGVTDRECSSVQVACLTTDFSMQNVLIQMGLNVAAVDGMLIKRAKNYVLRCYSCRRITTCMTRQFCGNCGNATLKRITMTIEADGSVRYFISRRKPISTRGMKFNLPAPRGGKHANNPWLFEDQRFPQQRASRKSQAKVNALDIDYVAGSSPFVMHDTTSRAAQLGIRRGRGGGRGRRK